MESAQPPEGTDRIEHWLVLLPGRTEPTVTDSAETAAEARGRGWEVEGPFVPAHQLTGAVEIIRALVAANDTHDGAIGEVRTAIGDERADQLLAILGGQP